MKDDGFSFHHNKNSEADVIVTNLIMRFYIKLLLFFKFNQSSNDCLRFAHSLLSKSSNFLFFMTIQRENLRSTYSENYKASPQLKRSGFWDLLSTHSSICHLFFRCKSIQTKTSRLRILCEKEAPMERPSNTLR